MLQKNSHSKINKNNLPDGFVIVSNVVPDVIQEIRYYSTYNLIGKRLDSYNAPIAILNKESANALKNAAEDFNSQGYYIKIFDAYRPQTAVNNFISWAKNINDTKMKNIFYPNVNKKELFSLGYIAEKSAHSRGSALDMTLIDMKSGKEIDAGSPYDFFDEISHHGTDKITEEQDKNRLIIKNTMERNGFSAYPNEWWHYTLNNEPYPDTYFDFPIDFYEN